jgi:hypothetical protein
MKHALLFTISALAVAFSSAQDTAKPIALFDGKSLAGWTNPKGEAPGNQWQVKDGELTLTNKGGGNIWTVQRYANFVLELEFKTTGNSGVFFRTDDRKDSVQTGLEVQVEQPSGPDKHSVGSLYDLQAPSKNLGKKDAWNKYKITARGSLISVELNGEKVNEIDVEKWSEAGKNPDGSANKYKRAVKDWKREGHIGFQDHGHTVAYRNINLTPLP